MSENCVNCIKTQIFPFFSVKLKFGKKKYSLRNTTKIDDFTTILGKKLGNENFQHRLLLYRAIGIFYVKKLEDGVKDFRSLYKKEAPEI